MTVETLGRGFGLYRRTAVTRSAIALLVANAIPLVGVLFFGWSLITILVLYWLENGIVGFWNVPKIIMAQGDIVPRLPDLPEAAARSATTSPAAAAALQEQWREVQAAQAQGITTRSRAGVLGPQARARLAAIPRVGLAMFFSFHYGMFWLVHGIFVFALPVFAGGFGSMTEGPAGCMDATGLLIPCEGTAFGDVGWPSVLLGGVALFLSHGASFFLNYLGRGEYRTASPSGQMASVYGRVVVLHLTIIFGSIVVAFLGAPIAALLILVVLKTAFDLGLHLRERRKATAPATTVPSPPPAPPVPTTG